MTNTRMSRWSVGTQMLWTYAFPLLVGGCSGNDLTGNLTLPPEATEHTYWALEFNHRAINLSTVAPYDTVQLRVTPRTLSGGVVSGATATPVYILKDTVSLRITPTGLLTARVPIADRVEIIARLTIDGATREDTTFVRVTNTVPSSLPQSMSVQPLPGDSSKWSNSVLPKDVIPVITSENGEPISDLLVAYRSSNRKTATVSDGALYGGAPGTTTITTTAYAYGVSLRDTVTYSITLPTFQVVGIGERPPATGSTPITYFSPDTVIIGVGGVVAFRTAAANTKDVSIVFETPSAAEQVPWIFPYMYIFDESSGNIDPMKPGLEFGAGRQFNVPGVYPFRDPVGQTRGIIIVREETP